MKRRQLTTTTTGTLATMLPLPFLSFDLVAAILCRLPVKLLLQLRCLCKSFNSLISDPKFAKKHLRLTTPRHHLMVSSRNGLCDVLIFDSTIHYVLSTSSVTQTQLHFPASIKKSYGNHVRVCSCEGILCFTMRQGYVALWNPSIRKFKMTPPLEKERIGRPFSIAWENEMRHILSTYSFGYDPFVHGYKIVAITFWEGKKEVSVHTLGTHFWRRIQDFPCSFYDSRTSGLFVSGTVNWLAYDASSSSLLVIVSLDLEKESYQKLWQPGLEKHRCILGVLNDCLCIFASSDMFLDVWVMNEYGNKESWTKLYCVPHIKDVGSYAYRNFLQIYEDDQMLVDFQKIGHNLGLYDSKNGILKTLENQNISNWMHPEVYIESLISPCF